MSEQTTESANSLPTSEFMTEVFLIIIALGFGFGVEGLVENPSLPVIARFLTLFVMLTAWLHDWFGYAWSGVHALPGSWFVRLLEHYTTIAAVLLLMSGGLLLSKEIAFYAVVLAAYGVDLFSEVLDLLRLRGAGSQYKVERELALFWTGQDVFTVLLAGVLILVRRSLDSGELVASVALLLGALASELISYSHNRHHYFGLPRPQSRTKAKASSEEMGAISDAGDDLERIEGIGPTIAGALRGAGITTYKQLAMADTGELRYVAMTAGVPGADPSTWPEQAGLAAAGDWESLNSLQRQLKRGRKA